MSIPANFRLDRIGQIALPVQELDRAVDFYQDVLGMPLLFVAPGMAFFDCGGIRLLLGNSGDDPEHRSSILYFRVDDIHRVRASLVERGVTFLQEPQLVHRAADHDLWLGFFRDSEDNVLALMSEVPHHGIADQAQGPHSPGR